MYVVDTVECVAHPGWAEGHYHLAQLYRVQQKRDAAKRELLIALELNPALSDAHMALGEIYIAENDLERAREHADRFVAVLVRQNSQAQLVRAALHEANVPVVLTGRTSVFATPAAAEWQRVLATDAAGSVSMLNPVAEALVELSWNNLDGTIQDTVRSGDDGRFLFHGASTWYRADGTLQRQATYALGQLQGRETCRRPDGTVALTREHQRDGTVVQTTYWPSGAVRTRSSTINGKRRFVILDRWLRPA